MFTYNTVAVTTQLRSDYRPVRLTAALSRHLLTAHPDRHPQSSDDGLSLLAGWVEPADADAADRAAADELYAVRRGVV